MNTRPGKTRRIEFLVIVALSAGVAGLIFGLPRDSIIGPLLLPYGPAFFIAWVVAGGHSSTIVGVYIAGFIAAFITHYALWYVAKLIWRLFKRGKHET
jgi:hypothetical protein